MMTLAQKIVLSVLVLVVLATSAAVLAVNLGFVAQGATQQTFAKWGSAAVLSEIVFLFVLVGKKVFNLGGRMSIQILPSPDFPTLKPGRIRWNDAKCFLKTEKVDARVRLINSSVGQTWTVHIPAKVAEKLADTDLVEFRFEDDRGNEWAAGPFLRNEYVIPLQSLDTAKIKTTYGR
jgi:hypothetical protein